MNYNLYLIFADEHLFHTHYLYGLIQALQNTNYHIIGLTIAKDSYKKGLFHAVKQQLHLWGLTGFLFLSLTTIFRKMIYKLGLRKKITLEGIAALYKIPVIHSHNVNNAEHISYLKRFQIDIIISSCGHIFKEELLSLPKIACINRHSALLPKYGGVLPVFWAMLAKEKTFGVSVHFMIKAIDKGKIISQKAIPIRRENSLFRNYMLAFHTSIGVTVEAIRKIKRNINLKKYSSRNVSYFSFPTNQTINLFKKNYSVFYLHDILYYYKNYHH